MMKAATRSQLAAAAGVSRQTFSKWLQTDWHILENYHCRRRRILPPAVVAYLCKKYDIDF